MTKGLLFWLIMLFWLVLGLYVVWPAAGPMAMAPAWYVVAAPNVVLFILLALLGWKVFGSPVKD